MKIIHCADLHLDSKIDSLPTDKSKIIREEVMRSFERLCDYAHQNDVSVVIIAGDMFDSAKISSKAKSRVITAIKKHPEVTYLYLTGNHDEESLLQSEKMPENFKMFNERCTTYRFGVVAITGMSARNENAQYSYDSLELGESDINIVTLHGQIAGYKSKEKASVISLPLLKDKNIDYLALGHIHSYAKGRLDNRGIYAYSGCLDGRGFDETGEKGFVLLEIIDGKIVDKFIPFAPRYFYEKEVTIENVDNWYTFRDDLIDSLKSSYNRDSLIKLVLKGNRKLNLDIDIEGLNSILNEYFFYTKICDKMTLSLTEEDFSNDKSVRGEFVRLVWSSDLPEEKKSAIITLGLNALKGEDIR